ncbi:short-chain fatty acid transporter [Streptococcus pyogenes]|nr:short-chain fatty acid transporter [Streptococcus pyogenes]
MNNIKTKKRFMDSYIDGFMKWMPESLFICFILTFLPATSGLSGAAVLYSATPDYLRNSVADAYKQVVPESVPLTESVLNLPFISLLVVCMLVPLCFALLAHPKDETKIMELDDEIYHHSLDTAHMLLLQETHLLRR